MTKKLLTGTLSLNTNKQTKLFSVCLFIVLICESSLFSDINDCASSPCQNNGTCHDMVNDFNCSCVAGFTDKMCQTSESASKPPWCSLETKLVDHLQAK